MAMPYTPNLAGSGRDFRRGAGSEALPAAKWREPTPPEETERRYTASRQNHGRAVQFGSWHARETISDTGGLV